MAHLYAHQKEGLEVARNNPRFAFFWGLGVGKSLLGLSIIQEFGEIHRALVVTRKNLIASAWTADHGKFGFTFALENTSGLPKPKRHEIYKSWGSHVITSFETFRIDYEQIAKAGFNLLIVDESAAIKDPNAQVSKRMLALSKKVSRAYLLSGLPAPNGEHEYWSQYAITAPGAFAPNYFAFRNQWFVPTKYIYMGGAKRPVQWALNAHKRKAFNERLKTNSWFLKKEECVDLPDQIFTTRKVQLPDGSRRIYDQLVRDWLTEVQGEMVVARNKLTEIMKVRQLCAGIMLTDDGVKELESPKTDELLSILQETEDYCIVVCEFQAEVERVVASLRAAGYTACSFYGKTPTKDRHQIVEDFQAGKYRVLAGHPDSMGPGLTLTRASTLVFHSLSYSYDNYFQVCGRIHRIGQKKPCNYIFLVAENTIDEVIAAALQHKQDVASSVLETLVRGKNGRAT